MTELFKAVFGLWEAEKTWEAIASTMDMTLTELLEDEEVFELYCK